MNRILISMFTKLYLGFYLYMIGFYEYRVGFYISINHNISCLPIFSLNHNRARLTLWLKFSNYRTGNGLVNPSAI
jgi:hypothetical protein